jgi:hypothetical protein
MVYRATRPPAADRSGECTDSNSDWSSEGSGSGTHSRAADAAHRWPGVGLPRRSGHFVSRHLLAIALMLLPVVVPHHRRLP